MDIQQTHHHAEYLVPFYEGVFNPRFLITALIMLFLLTYLMAQLAVMTKGFHMIKKLSRGKGINRFMACLYTIVAWAYVILVVDLSTGLVPNMSSDEVCYIFYVIFATGWMLAKLVMYAYWLEKAYEGRRTAKSPKPRRRDWIYILGVATPLVALPGIVTILAYYRALHSSGMDAYGCVIGINSVGGSVFLLLYLIYGAMINAVSILRFNKKKAKLTAAAAFLTVALGPSSVLIALLALGGLGWWSWMVLISLADVWLGAATLGVTEGWKYKSRRQQAQQEAHNKPAEEVNKPMRGRDLAPSGICDDCGCAGLGGAFFGAPGGVPMDNLVASMNTPGV